RPRAQPGSATSRSSASRSSPRSRSDDTAPHHPAAPRAPPPPAARAPGRTSAPRDRARAPRARRTRALVPAARRLPMKLPKRQAKRDKGAVALAHAERPLTRVEREFVLAPFREGAEHMTGLHGAFVTPPGLARDFSVEVPSSGRILDLCAGIGALSYA